MREHWSETFDWQGKDHHRQECQRFIGRIQALEVQQGGVMVHPGVTLTMHDDNRWSITCDVLTPDDPATPAERARRVDLAEMDRASADCLSLTPDEPTVVEGR